MERKPGRGDIIWLDFNPTRGHEQAGKRPAIVLSPEEYNSKTGLALVCPITSKAKGYPFEVPIKGKVSGVVLADQVRAVDWQERNWSHASKDENVAGRAAELIKLLLP